MSHHVVHHPFAAGVDPAYVLLPSLVINRVLPVQLHASPARAQQRLMLVVPCGYHVNAAHHHRARVVEDRCGTVRD